MSEHAHTRFVILAAPRSGSNMLCSLLHSHQHVLCHHELYNPADIFYALPLRKSAFQLAQSTKERDQEPLLFLDKIWRHNLSMPCVGFKMTHRQNAQVFQALLADHSIKKILLKRKNAVKSYVSKLIAQGNGIWEDYGDQKDRHHTAVTVDIDQLNEDIAFNQDFYQEIESSLKSSAQQYCALEYEQLQNVNSQKRLLDFIGLNYQPLTTASIKQNPTDLRKIVSNYSELLENCANDTLRQQLIDQSM